MTKQKREKLPAAPAHLSREAAEIWREVTAYLSACGRLQLVDRGTVETYADACIRQRVLQAALDRDGVMMDGKPHPALRTIEAVAATVTRTAYALGLTPASRAKLPPPAKKQNGKGASVWDGVLGE